MRITDNGKGFDQKAVTAGNGLRNLQERAREIKARLDLKSRLGEGTEVELHLPLA
jgi:signal transduction histidine kinase